MASEVLISISKDEVERARLMSEYKYQLDTQSKLTYARQKGREEGIGIGEQKTQKHVLELIEQGLSVDEIKQRLTNN